MKFSNRVLCMQASPIRKLMPYANKAKAAGVKVYHLNIGQPDIKTPEVMMDAIRKVDMAVLPYGPSEGLPEYRNALPAYYAKYGINIEADDILVTTAGSEAIIFAMMSICDAGDEVIIPEPFYTNYNGFADMCGVKVVSVTSRVENGFALPSLAEIEAKITGRTKAIFICNPGNPTGAVYSREELQGLANLVKKHDLYLLGDEVYREFVYEGEHSSVLDFPEISEHAIVVDSVSKRYSACGARIGCLISKNRELLKHMLKMAQARLCPPTIEQMAALAAIQTPDSYFVEVKEEYKKRRDLVFNAIKEMPGTSCQLPRGAFYLVTKLPVDDAEKFAIFMLDEFRLNNETVMVAPAEGFYATPGLGRDEIRIAYILNTTDLARSMEILKAGLAAYNK